MISPAEITAAKAVPIAAVVGQVVELKNDFALCCFHTERSPSLHIYRKTNTFHCFGCGARGDTIEFIRRVKQLDFPSAVRELADVLPQNCPTGPKAPRATEVPSLVLELWHSATSPNIAEWYLNSRNVMPKRLPGALRGHSGVWCEEARERRPCVLAAISGEDGRITAIQRVWIKAALEYDGHTEFERGSRSPDLSAGKKSLGPLRSGAVRLAEAGDILGLAEGFETALAAAKLYRLPVWATCGLSRLGYPAHTNKHGARVSERPPAVAIPPEVRRVILFADNGEPGHTVADFACSWWRRQSLQTQVVYPDEGYGDFADMVRS